jgi:hypothetical protein
MSETRNELEDEGIPDLQDTVTSDDNEGLIPPRDYPQAVNEFGTTAAEESRGESLAQRVAREEPDFGEQGAPSGDLDDETGRVVEPISDGGIDEEAASIGDLVTDDAGGLSAEEAAIHVVDENDAL